MSSKARDPKLEKYLDTVQRMEASFEGFLVKNILRGNNEQVDLLAKSEAQRMPLPLEVFFEILKAKAPSVDLIKKLCLQYHQHTAKIGEQKLYLFSKAITH
jgi:hypothetical protein